MSAKKVSYPLQVLSGDEVEKIYHAALEILQHTGVQFEDRQVLDTLQEKGCLVDYRRMRAMFSPALVEAALKACPAEFTVHARNPKYNLTFDGSHVYFASHSAPTVVDPQSATPQKPSVQDIRQRLTLIDALEHIDATLTLAGEISDIPVELGVEWVKAETFRQTEKPTTAPAFGDSPRWIIRMAEVAGTQVIGCGCCTPPLYYPKQDTDAMLLYAAAGFPVTPGSGIALGGTGPVTLAGTLAQQTAEALAGVVLVQTSYPGTGILCITETAPMDMRVGDIAWGSIEVGLLHAALGQLARFLGLQSFSLFPMSNAHICDQQLGFEKGMQAILMALSGTHLMSGGGGVYNESSVCLEQLVIDNDIYGMAARYLEGITVNEETLALDVIGQVAPDRGSYLKHAHTRKLFRQEHFFPGVSNRLTYQTWQKQGARNIVTTARERVDEILAQHEPVPLPREAERELDSILKAITKERMQVN